MHSVAVDFLVVVAALEVRAVHEERGVVAFADDLARVGRVQYGKRQLAARVQHTGGFAHATGQVIGVYEEVGGHDEVETVAGGGQLGRVRHQVVPSGCASREASSSVGETSIPMTRWLSRRDPARPSPQPRSKVDDPGAAISSKNAER